MNLKVKRESIQVLVVMLCAIIITLALAICGANGVKVHPFLWIIDVLFILFAVVGCFITISELVDEPVTTEETE